MKFGGAGLITWTKYVQNNFQSDFCDQWSISFSLKSHFSMSKIIWIFLKHIFIGEYQLITSFFLKVLFIKWRLQMLIFVGLFNNFDRKCSKEKFYVIFVIIKIHWHGQKLTKANAKAGFVLYSGPAQIPSSLQILAHLLVHRSCNKNLSFLFKNQSKCGCRNSCSKLFSEAGPCTQFRLCLHFKLRLILSLSRGSVGG